MKLWQKNTDSLQEVETFTVGKDREFDLLLAPFDVLGNIAHAKMLATVGLLSPEEAAALTAELRNIYHSIQQAAIYHTTRCGRCAFADRISADAKAGRYG